MASGNQWPIYSLSYTFIFSWYIRICHLLYNKILSHLWWLSAMAKKTQKTKNSVWQCPFNGSYLEKALCLRLMPNFCNSTSWTFSLLWKSGSTLDFCMLPWWACNFDHSYKALSSRMLLNLSLWLSFLSLPLPTEQQTAIILSAVFTGGGGRGSVPSLFYHLAIYSLSLNV